MFSAYTYRSAYGGCRECDGCMTCQSYREDEIPDDYDDVKFDEERDEERIRSYEE